MSAKKYEKDYKVQSVKLALEVGQSKAAKELGISKNTLCGWIRAARVGSLDMGENVILKGNEYIRLASSRLTYSPRLKPGDSRIRTALA